MLLPADLGLHELAEHALDAGGELALRLGRVGRRGDSRLPLAVITPLAAGLTRVGSTARIEQHVEAAPWHAVAGLATLLRGILLVQLGVGVDHRVAPLGDARVMETPTREL